jgi:hypothetical protein
VLRDPTGRELLRALLEADRELDETDRHVRPRRVPQALAVVRVDAQVVDVVVRERAALRDHVRGEVRVVGR